MAKQPAQLSDSLLSNRPRKGAALPQTETEAAAPKTASPKPESTPTQRRRKRRSNKTMQLNLRVSPAVLDRFTKLADDENLMFGDLLEKLLEEQ